MNQREELTAVAGTKCENCKGNGYVVGLCDDYIDKLQRCEDCKAFESDDDAWKNAEFTIKHKKFTTWYFSDYDNIQDLGYEAMHNLIGNKSFTITAEDLLNKCYYIPTHLVEELDGIKYDFDIEPRQIKLIP